MKRASKVFRGHDIYGEITLKNINPTLQIYLLIYCIQTVVNVNMFNKNFK